MTIVPPSVELVIGYPIGKSDYCATFGTIAYPIGKSATMQLLCHFW